MSTGYAPTEIMQGGEVFGADGAKVGTVATVYPGYIIVEKGFFFPTDYYIPLSAIASVDADRVYLTISKDEALNSGWDARPADLETATATTGSSAATTGAYADTDVYVDAHRTAATTDASTATGTVVDAGRSTAARVGADEELRIPVVEEELTATARPQAAGAVRIEKDVVAEERTLDVPVTEERVRIERRAVDRPAAEADLGAFQDAVIEVPLRRETVDVQKEPRVREEIVVSKEAVQRTERVAGTVRKEQVSVDEEDVVDPTLIEGTEGGRTTRP
jgi:uncharacterized protein (TIGR02271 family)